MADELTFEECEQNRHDPQWGDPVRDLALHASHWIESAIARYPDRREELNALDDRLAEATGEISRKFDFSRYNGIFANIETEGEIVVALEAIVAIMRRVAPLLVRDTKMV